MTTYLSLHFWNFYARKRLMERYKRYIGIDAEEKKHPTVGNLYIARDIKDMRDAVEWIMLDYSTRMKSMDYGPQAMVALMERFLPKKYREFIPAYIYIPNVRHEQHLSMSRQLTIFDHTGRCEIRVEPTQLHNKDKKIGLKELRRSWYSDVVILGIYPPEGSYYHLSHYLGGHVPEKRFIGKKIIEVEAT